VESRDEYLSWPKVFHHLVDDANYRYVQPEYLLAPPDAEEKPVVIKEHRKWFWQRSKKEEQNA
jgi:hypothetical protein